MVDGSERVAIHGATNPGAHKPLGDNGIRGNTAQRAVLYS
jgi:hypothetical protein